MSSMIGHERSYLGVKTVRATEGRQDFERIIANTLHRKQALKAGKMMTLFRQSPAQHYMTFQQFQKPRKRNEILRDYGLEAIFLTGEDVPAKELKRLH